MSDLYQYTPNPINKLVDQSFNLTFFSYDPIAPNGLFNLRQYSTTTIMSSFNPISSFYSGGTLNSPFGIVTDTFNNVYVANSGNSTISKITSTGQLSTYFYDVSKITSPVGLAIDPYNNLYVSDNNFNTIIKILASDPSHPIVYNTSTIFQDPAGLALDASQNLYVIAGDLTNNDTSIFQLSNMDLSGNFSYASIFPKDGSNNALFNGERGGIVFDTSYNLYVANVMYPINTGRSYVSKITFPLGIDASFTDFSCNVAFSNDPSNNIIHPIGITRDFLNNIYVGSINPTLGGGSIYQVDPVSGNIIPFLTDLSSVGLNTLSFTSPFGLAFDQYGNLFISDNETNRIFEASTQNIYFTNVPTTNLTTGQNNLEIFLDPFDVSGVVVDVSNQMACFLEGTMILTDQGYVAIETLRKGTLVKTLRNGYVKVKAIGTSQLYNSGNEDRIKDRLYCCSKTEYPELIEDLVMTGCHSILVDQLTDVQEDDILNLLGQVYITDNKYRLMAQFDEKAKPYREEGLFEIWHLALEHEDPYMNYGVYANGLLVETTSIRFLYELANMVILT